MLSNDSHLIPDPLAISLTKPACYLGVPLAAFYSNVMICFMLAMLTMNMTHGGLGVAFIFLIVFAVNHTAMAIISFKDVFGLTLFWMNFVSFPLTAHFKRWGNTDSYSP